MGRIRSFLRKKRRANLPDLSSLRGQLALVERPGRRGDVHRNSRARQERGEKGREVTELNLPRHV